MVKVARIDEELTVPEGVTAVLDGRTLTVKGPNGTLKRTFDNPRITIEQGKGNVSLHCKSPRKKDKALVGTWRAHINNMYKGVTEGFEYTMKIVYSHFPIKTSVRDDKVFIENFLGERHPHQAQIVGDATVKISGDQVVITGANREEVGQTAANIESSTKITRRDPRVFQDGIYIISKGR